MADSSPIPLSLYVHVPFCAAKCRYCDFYSEPIDRDAGPGGVAARVVDQTLAQLDRFLDRAPEVRFETVYVGGGTPSVLPPILLERLLDRLSSLAPAEWTVEANPESLDRGFLEACARAGVTRLSVGLQSMDDRLLALLGRPATAADNLRALDLLGTAWDRASNLDLIAGIPGQSPESTIADVHTSARARVGHVSLYSLTVEPHTTLAVLVRSGDLMPNPRELDEEIWLAGRAALEEAGLQQYEVSNFARPGMACRHNLRYWRLEPYLGIGPAAVSTLPPDLAATLTGARYDTAVVRLANPRDIEAFLAGADGTADAPWGIEAETVAVSSFVLETLMMGLRLVEGIGAESFQRRFGQDLDRIAPGVWQRWLDRGLAAADPTRLRMTGRGLLVLDPLLGELAEALRADGLPKITVRWPDGSP